MNNGTRSMWTYNGIVSGPSIRLDASEVRGEAVGT